MAQVSGQSCGQAARTTLRSTEIFSVGAGIGNSAISRRSGPRDGKRPEAHAQHLADPVVGVVCRGDRPAHGKKSVYLPLEALVGDGNAGLRKTLGVGFAFVEERIETGGDDIRGRQVNGILSLGDLKSTRLDSSHLPNSYGVVFFA